MTCPNLDTTEKVDFYTTPSINSLVTIHQINVIARE
jgi:hypothetical protein